MYICMGNKFFKHSIVIITIEFIIQIDNISEFIPAVFTCAVYEIVLFDLELSNTVLKFNIVRAMCC